MLQLNFEPFPELQTQRLLLRKMRSDDAPELFFLSSDETVLKYLGREPPKNAEEVSDFIDTIDKSIASAESILWAITLKEDPDKLIGTICFWNIQKEN